MANVVKKVDEEAVKGMNINSIVKWNRYLERVKIDDKPLMPFANQIAFLRSNEQEVLYGGGTRGGKMSPVETQVVTPFGLKHLGDLKVGDLVCTPDGSSSKIIQIHEHGEKDVYKVTFVDGRSLEVGLEHLWKIKKTRNNRRKSNKNGEGGWYISNTEQMINCLNKERKYNLAVPLTKAVNFTKSYKYNMRPVSPYAVGIFIGDGSLTNEYNDTIKLTSADDEIVEYLKEDGYIPIKIYSSFNEKTGVTTKDITYEGEIVDGFEKLGLKGKYSYNKFIPEYYKYAPVEDRIALIQGLMDTDGYVDDRGHLSYTTTSEQLAKDVQWVIRSLGGRASITDKIPTYTHEEIKKEGRKAYTVWIQIKNKDRLVRLTRKKERCKDCDYIGGFQDPSLTITNIEYSRKAKCRCITISHVDGLYLADDFVVTHNSIAMLMSAAQYVDIPNYNAIIFRKTYQELSKGDGLIPTSMIWFNQFKDEGVRWNDDNMQWEFPNGSILGFGYLASERDKYKYIGQAYQFIGFDELTQQPEENYTFLFSRLVRNKFQEAAGIPLRVRSTTNPNGDHVQWVYDRFVNKRTRKHIRDKIIEAGTERLNCTKEELPEDYIKYRMPKFIPSLARDNPYLDKITYQDSLDKLDPVQRAQLENGDWEIRAMGNMFNREWFEKIPYAKVPYYDLKKVRYWDMAATRDGDFTASCHLGYDDKTGMFYILDMTLFKKPPVEVEREIYLAAIDDGPQTTIYMEREPGSAGLHNFDHYKRKVIPPGWYFKEDRVSGDKEARARPVSAASSKGLIKIAWTRKCDNWFNPVMEQLETFPEGEHDDACLVKGTKISTVFGVKNIEHIKSGDKIICKEGIDTVIECLETNISAEVYELVFSNGIKIQATANHPFYCPSKNTYINVDSIKSGDDFLWLEKEHTQLNMKKLNSTELPIGDIRIQDISHTETILDQQQITSGMDTNTIIKSCGKNTMDQFQPDFTFITKMETRLIMNCPILNALMEKNTFQNTQKNGMKIIKNNNVNILKESEIKHLNGIRVKKGDCGTNNMLKNKLKIENLRRSHVAYVEKNLNHTKNQNFALRDVIELVENKKTYVNVAEEHLLGPKESKHAVKIVKLISVSKLSEKKSVWNIQTRNHHNYFANGINVHNCDALSSAFNVLSKRIYSKGRYIGKADWLLPTETTTEKLTYGPKEQMTINDLISGKKVSF